MGLATFRQGSDSSTGGLLPIHKMACVTLPNHIYGHSGLPVIRSGIIDKYFNSTTDDSVTLYTLSVVGVATVVATISFNTYLTGGEGAALHLSSADSCLYVLLRNGGDFRLIKIADTTGVVTTIGSSFTPTTAANWPSLSTESGKLEVDTVSGHIKVWGIGYTHLINKTTGAIVSQDTLMTIGAFYPKDVRYITQDGSVGVTKTVASTSPIGYVNYPAMIHSTYGISNPTSKLNTSDFNLPTVSGDAIRLFISDFILVDTDKVCGFYLNNSGSFVTSSKLYLRSEFDSYLKSVALVILGVD